MHRSLSIGTVATHRHFKAKNIPRCTCSRVTRPLARHYSGYLSVSLLTIVDSSAYFISLSHNWRLHKSTSARVHYGTQHTNLCHVIQSRITSVLCSYISSAARESDNESIRLAFLSNYHVSVKSEKSFRPTNRLPHHAEESFKRRVCVLYNTQHCTGSR